MWSPAAFLRGRALPRAASVLAPAGLAAAAPSAAAAQPSLSLSAQTFPSRGFSMGSRKKLKLSDTMFRARQRTTRISQPAAADGSARPPRPAGPSTTDAAGAAAGPLPPGFPNIDLSNPEGLSLSQLESLQNFMKANPDMVPKQQQRVSIPKRRPVRLPPDLSSRGAPARSIRGLTDTDMGVTVGFGPALSAENIKKMAEKLIGPEATADLMGRSVEEVLNDPRDEVTLERMLEEEIPYIDEQGRLHDPGAAFDQDGLSMKHAPMDTPERMDLPRYPLPPPEQLPLPVIDPSEAVAAQDGFDVLMGDIPFPNELPDQPYAVRVCVLGTPNSGKSVLVNNITRAHISAVSQKRNTTRRQILGVLTEANTQVTLFDTPGINEIREAKQYQRELATEAWDAVAGADMALVVIDAAKRIGGPELFMLHKAHELTQSNPALRLILILNKVDLVEPKNKLLELLSRLAPLAPFTDCFMISALTGDGVADVENYLFNNSVPREWEHAAEAQTDLSEQDVALQLVRETVFQRLNQELPYAVEPQIAEWEVLRNGTLRVDITLEVRRQQHRSIVVGAQGGTMAALTRVAEAKLREQFGRTVYVYFRVKVNESKSH